MEHAIQIEPGRDVELRALFALARETFGAMSGWNDARAFEPLAQDVVFVAHYDELPAGYVALHEERWSVRVDQLFVAQRAEAELIGDRLLDHAEGYAISRGARSLEVVVEPDNMPAHKLYRRRGLVPVAEQLLECILPAPP